MEINATQLKRCELVKVSGRLDSNTAPEFEQALRSAMDRGGHRLVVDLSGVEFLGSAAIRVLVMAVKECRRRNRGDLRLASVPPRVQHVLDLAGITPLLKTYEDDVQAVGSF